jgi:hypothetical protein
MSAQPGQAAAEATGYENGRDYFFVSRVTFLQPLLEAHWAMLLILVVTFPPLTLAPLRRGFFLSARDSKDSSATREKHHAARGRVLLRSAALRHRG